MDDHKLAVYVPDVEDDYLEPILGSTLFGQLLNFMQTESPDVADPLAKLANEAKKMLCRWVVVEAWPDILVHITNAGVVVKTGSKDAGTTSADIVMTDRSVAKHRDRAQKSTDKLVRWLQEHKSDYPSYAVPCSAPASGMLLGGLYLG
jgi:hypothetical protein